MQKPNSIYQGKLIDGRLHNSNMTGTPLKTLCIQLETSNRAIVYEHRGNINEYYSSILAGVHSV